MQTFVTVPQIRKIIQCSKAEEIAKEHKISFIHNGDVLKKRYIPIHPAEHWNAFIRDKMDELRGQMGCKSRAAWRRCLHGS